MQPEQKYREYSPVPDDESSQTCEQDELLQRRCPSTWSLVPAFRWRNKLTIFLVLITIVVIYSTLLIAATSWWWRRECLHGPRIVETPIRDFVQYEPTHINIGHSSKDYIYMGHPSSKLDAAWQDLMADFYTEIPESYIKRVGRLDEAIPTSKGKFLNIYSFMHQLHCMKRLHHSYWPEVYYPNTTEQDRFNLQEHELHCLEMIMRALMCRPDTRPETLHWVEEGPFPLGNRDSPQECVNWDLFMTGVKKSRVDIFTPGLLVHPIYGPVVPEGRHTVIGKDKKHRFITNETIIRNWRTPSKA